MRDLLISSIIGPLIVGVVVTLLDHWLDDRHNNRKK